MEREIVECISYAVIEDGDLMVERRMEEGSGYYGLLIIPGGRVESGENPGLAAVREAEEEYCIRVLSMAYLGDMTKESLSSGKLLHFNIYVITAFDGEPRNMEPNKGLFRWIPLEHAKEALQLESSHEIVDRVLSFIRSQSS